MPVLGPTGGGFMNFKHLHGENVLDREEEWILHQANTLNQLPVQSKTSVSPDRVICKINKARCSSLPS